MGPGAHAPVRSQAVKLTPRPPKPLPPYRPLEFPWPAGLPLGTALWTRQRACVHFPFTAGRQQRDYLPHFTVRENEAWRAYRPPQGSPASLRPQVSRLPSWPTSPPTLCHMAEFPRFSPWTAVSSPTHQRNVSHTACFAGHRAPANSQLPSCSPPAKQAASIQRSRSHLKILAPPSHTPKPFQVIATLPNYNSGERGEILSAIPANSNCRRITPIPCWRPHLSPSASPAKANFPLTSG